MAVVSFPARNKLAYPVGRMAGVDPTHPAAQGLAFSLVHHAGGAQFLNLVTGLPTVYAAGVSNPTTAIDGNVGLSTRWDASNTKAAQVAAPVATPVAVTFGIMLRPLALQGAQGYFALITTDPNTHLFYLQDPAGAALTPDIHTGAGHNYASFALTVGAPYFLAYSGSLVNGEIGYFVAKNLSTGQLLQSKITLASTYTATDATLFNVGDNTTFDSPTNANIAAAMYSPNLALSLSELLQWADDPWAFWYPPQQRSRVAAAAAVTPTTVLYSLMNVG